MNDNLNGVLQDEADYFGSIIQDLQEQNKRYREALEFYASDETWKIDETNYSDADKYKGKVAHEALEGEE